MYKSYYKPVNKSKPHRKQEESLQLRVCQYLRTHYPDVIFRSDFASGLYLSPFQASKHAKLQSGRSFPDLAIYERSKDGQFTAMFLELKREGTRIWLKNGNLTADQHINEQAAQLYELQKRGYYADFSIGLSETIEKIHGYLGTPVDQFDF